MCTVWLRDTEALTVHPAQFGRERCVLLGIGLPREGPGCPPPPPKLGLGVKRPTSRLRPACPCLWRWAAFRKSWRGDIALCTSWLSLAHPISSRITAEDHGDNRKKHIGYGLARRFPDPVRGGAVQPVRSPRRSLLCS